MRRKEQEEKETEEVFIYSKGGMIHSRCEMCIATTTSHLPGLDALHPLQPSSSPYSHYLAYTSFQADFGLRLHPRTEFYNSK